VGTDFVVMSNPIRNDGLCLKVGLEAMLPDALELERSHERFGEEVLLWRMRQDKFAGRYSILR